MEKSMDLRTLTVGIATYNRKSMLENMAKSLYLSDLSAFKVNIRLYDDCSTEFNRDFLEKTFPDAASIIVNETNLKADYNTFNMYRDFIKSGDDYFFNADSDLLFNKDWLNFIKENFNKTDGVLSVFNTTRHHPVIEDCGDLVCKEHIGAAGTFFSRERVKQIVENLSEQATDSVDWGFFEYFMNNKVRIMCSKRSFVQHIGLVSGENSNLYSADYGTGFSVDSIHNGQILNNLIESMMDTMPEYIDKVKYAEGKRIEGKVKDTKDFKIGKAVLKPIRMMKHIIMSTK